MRATKLVAGTLAVLALALTVAHAGTVIVVDTWAYDQYSESGVLTIYLGENKARAEIARKEDAVHIIYNLENKDAPVMWIIEPAGQTYTKMDKETIKKTQDKIQEMSEMLANYLSTASPDERDEINKKYKKEIRQANKVIKYEERMKKMTYEKVAGGEKVKAWTCDHLKGMFNKDLYKEVWVAGWSDVGAEPKDVAVLSAIGEAFKGFGGEILPFTNQQVKGSDGPLNGFPVKTVFYEDGNKIVRQEVKEIRKEELDDKLFVLPEGYTEKPPIGQ
jgi:rubrerythrin